MIIQLLLLLLYCKRVGHFTERERERVKMVSTRASNRRKEAINGHIKHEQEEEQGCLTAPPHKLKWARTGLRLSNSVEPHGGSKRMSRKITNTQVTHATAEHHTEEATLAAKRSEENSLLHQRRQFVSNHIAALRNSTIQPSEPAVPLNGTQQEMQVSSFIAGNEIFQKVTEEDRTMQGPSCVQVLKRVISGPKGSEAMELSKKSDEGTGSQGGNNVASNNITDQLGENSNNGFQGRSLVQRTMSLNLTEFAEQMDIDGLDDEVDSFGSNTNLVSVGGYRVKPEYETLLYSILVKYGDIASNSSLTTVAYRSFSMELLCEVFQKLMATDFIGIKDSDLETMMSQVQDFEKANIKIEWLKMRLNEICKAKKAVQFLREHRQDKSEVQKMNDQFEVYAREVAIKRVELGDLEKKMYAAKCNMAATEEKYKNTEKAREESKAHLRHIIKLGSLVEGLLGN